MKTSRYNRTVRIPGQDQYLLFNGITAALISLDGQLFEKAHQIMVAVDDGREVPKDEETQKTYKMLVDGRFIIPRSVDELALLRVRYNLSRFNNPLSLTILPTLACNLACVYCYERPRHDLMTEDTMEAIATFVEQRAKRERISEFHVTWYGGEPLLAAPRIWDLSRRFLDLSERYAFRYTAAITTNGTLLTKDVADSLLRYNVTSMQVTVDGPKQIHDERRPFRKGKRSSFDSILRNLDNVVGKMEIFLRINTDKRNAGFVLELLRMFADRGWLDKGKGKGKRFYPYMAPVRELTQACADIAPECCTMEEFFDLSVEFCRACEAYGVPIKTRAMYHFPVSLKYNCGAIALNSMVVNPSGAIHKCGLTVNDENESLGNIREPLDLANRNLLKWLNFDPFDTEGCRKCDLLPVCLGSCPKRVLEGEDPTKSNSCAYMKRNIDTILMLHAT